MAEQSTLERVGVRFASVGSSANLLVAAPKANGGPTVTGNLDTDAATAANRTGYYFDQTAAAERLGFMVGGQVGPLFSRNGAVVDLAITGALVSTLPTGTAPLTIASVTLVPNLYVARSVLADSATTNANLTGPITSVGNATSVASQTGTGTTFVMNTSPTLVTPVLGAATGTTLSLSGQFTSTLVTGTAPLVITSTTNVANLNASSLNGATFAAPGAIGGGTPGTAAFTTISATGVITSTLVTGTAPLTVASTTQVANLYASRAALADAVTTNANLTGPITSVGNATSVASQTGTGSTFVMNTSPTLVTPLLGTPTSGVLTNCTGTAAGLTAGNVTTNANLTGPITSVGNATSVASQTGTGTTFVMNTSPTLVTPVIGAATGTTLSLSGQFTNTLATGTAPFVVSSTTMVANLYVARAALADTATTVTTNANLTGPITSVGNATSVASQTGTGTTFVMNTSPTLVTPVLGVASGTSLALSSTLSLSGGMKWTSTTFSNAAVVLTSSYIIAAQTGTMSASRTATLPAANSVTAGTIFLVSDYSGTVTSTNSIVVTPTGADTVNGGASYTIGRAYGTAMVVSDGISAYTLLMADELPTLVSGKWLTNNGTSVSWGTIATTDISGLGSMALQSSGAIAVTGGTLSGITSMAAAVTSTVTSGTVTLSSSTITANPGSASTGIYQNAVASNTSASTAQNLTSATAGLVALSATITHAGTGVITGADCIQVQGTTSGASGTITTMRGLHVLNATKGGGTTITTQVGVEVDSITSGTTNFSIRTGTGSISVGDSTDSTTGGTGSLFTLGGIGITKALYVGSTITGAGNGTITTSAPALSLTQTWNAAGVAFTGILSNITSTASAAGSLLLDLQVASSTIFNVNKTGAFVAAAATDIVGQIGYAKIGFVPSGTSTSIYIGQTSVFTTSNYALLQNSVGDTAINAASNKSVTIRQNNATRFTVANLVCTFATTCTIAPAVVSSGTSVALLLTGALNTNMTLSTEVPDADFNLARNVQWATGALTTQRAVVIRAPTYAFVGASTITNAATFAITGAPILGTNATFTNSYALWVQGGNTRLDGRQFLNAAASAPTDADIPTSAVSWYLNEAGNLLSVRVRYSDGTTLKTGTVALV